MTGRDNDFDDRVLGPATGVGPEVVAGSVAEPGHVMGRGHARHRRGRSSRSMHSGSTKTGVRDEERSRRTHPCRQ